MTAPASSTSTDRIPFARTPMSEEAPAAVARVLSSGWVTTGPEVAAFEQEFAAWMGADHAVAVESCTAALELSLRALRLPPGSPVLTSTITFCGAVNAILHAGLRPVLVDVDPRTLMPDERTTAAAVRTAGDPAAMVALHFAGHPAPVVVDCPTDVQNWTGTYTGENQVPIPGYRQRGAAGRDTTLSDASCQQFYSRLGQSKRPPA